MDDVCEEWPGCVRCCPLELVDVGGAGGSDVEDEVEDARMTEVAAFPLRRHARAASAMSTSSSRTSTRLTVPCYRRTSENQLAAARGSGSELRKKQTILNHVVLMAMLLKHGGFSNSVVFG